MPPANRYVIVKKIGKPARGEPARGRIWREEGFSIIDEGPYDKSEANMNAHYYNLPEKSLQVLEELSRVKIAEGNSVGYNEGILKRIAGVREYRTRTEPGNNVDYRRKRPWYFR